MSSSCCGTYRRRGFWRNSCSHPTKPTTCTVDGHHQLHHARCCLASRGSIPNDLPSTPSRVQAPTTGDDRLHLPTSWTLWSRRICVRASLFLCWCPRSRRYRFMKLGKVALDVFPKTKTLHASAGEFFYMSGFSMALFLWGFGLVWLCLALASISRYRKIPFNVSWWAATFPWGVYATSTMQIGVELPSRFFRILGVVSSPE